MSNLSARTAGGNGYPMVGQRAMVDDTHAEEAAKTTFNRPTDQQDLQDQQDREDHYHDNPVESDKSGNTSANEKTRPQQFFNKHKNKPFSDYAICCREFNNQKSSKGKWHSLLWWFVFLLRGHSEMLPFLAKDKSAEAWERINREVLKWPGAENEQPIDDPWVYWFGVNSLDDAEIEFCKIWESTQQLPGDDPLTGAYAKAKIVRVELTDKIAKRPGVKPNGHPDKKRDYHTFVSLAAHLAVGRTDPIMLPRAKIAEMLGLSHTTISTYCNWMEEDGFLVKTAEHIPLRRAAEYRFVDGFYKCVGKPIMDFALEIE